MFAIGPKQHLDKIDVDNDDSATRVKVFSIGPNGHLDKTEELILTFHKIFVDKIDNYGEDKDNEDEEDLGEYEDEDRVGKVLILKMMMNSVNCCLSWLMITPFSESPSF